MSQHCRHTLFAALIALLAVGCHRAVPVPASAKGGAVTAVPGAVADYRTMSKADVQALIASKTGSEVTELKDAGPNRYTGTIVAPGGTPLPLTVTVEAQRIVFESRIPAGLMRQAITPQGLQDLGLDIK